MKTVIQRVLKAEVTAGRKSSKIEEGILSLVAVKKGDSPADAAYLAEKTAHLRIFEDDSGKMNFSVRDTEGSVMAVPQVTLYGDCLKGRRPGFDDCASYSEGLNLFNIFVRELKSRGVHTETGFYGKDMSVELINDGPVTFIVESK
ncbi:MAG: D-aminoacyl-tRNA deacylase [Elusimicrobiota bacterium]|nr:D-aminoacyl-tRNA deacylase [Elusimicrobiota bacterium]